MEVSECNARRNTIVLARLDQKVAALLSMCMTESGRFGINAVYSGLCDKHMKKQKIISEYSYEHSSYAQTSTNPIDSYHK